MARLQSPARGTSALMRSRRISGIAEPVRSCEGLAGPPDGTRLSLMRGGVANSPGVRCEVEMKALRL
jgi:hypothetical protein